jgi:ABC-type antimicrobial peptide transport system permease subunit
VLQVYLPASQDSGRLLLVKHDSRGQHEERFLMQALALMFPGANVMPLSADVARARQADRSRALALQLFCALTVLLAALGLLANQAALLDTRRRELALRLALGADLPHVRRRIVMPSALGALAGAPAGVLIGVGCGRIGESLFVGVSAIYVPGMVTVPMAAAAIAVSVALYGARAVDRLSPASILSEAS